jgi:hypothetical protein
VICSENWEVLGRALTENDIQRLDSYMVKCNLGPLRLGLALKAEWEADTVEMAKIHTKARKTLAALRHKKKSRLRRLAGACGAVDVSALVN